MAYTIRTDSSSEFSQMPSLCFHDPKLEERLQIDKEITNLELDINRAKCNSISYTSPLAIDEFKKVMTQLESKLLELRTKRNSLIPIASLFPEILSRIFSIASVTGSKGERSPKRLVYISSVCRHWREVALRCPSLWTTINLKNTWASEFLERSKQAVLQVLRVTDEENALKTITENFHRLRHLDFYLHSHMRKDVQSLFNTPSPNLQLLTIKYVGSSQILLPRHAPLLRYLAISDSQSFSMKTIAPICSRLTELRISDTYGSIQLHDCLTQLASMPLLETLMLENALNNNSSLHALPEINLPHLHRLRLTKTNVSLWLPFIRSIPERWHCHEESGLRLNGSMRDEDIPTYLQVVALAKVGAPKTSSSYEAAKISPHSITIGALDKGDTLFTQLTARHGWAPIDHIAIFQQIRYHSFQELTMSLNAPPPEIWSHFPNLRELSLLRGAVVAFITHIACLYLRQQTQGTLRGGEITAPTFLPALRSLTMGDRPDFEAAYIQDLHRFRYYFQKREEEGIGLKTLTLTENCSPLLRVLGDCAEKFIRR